MQLRNAGYQSVEKLIDFGTGVVKFLPPEDEIRAQLRELTSQTRQLRADLQGLITRRGATRATFPNDQRYRLKPEPSSSADDSAAVPKPQESKPPEPKRRSTKSTKKRSTRR